MLEQEYSISAILDGSLIINGQTISFDRLGSHTIEITAEDFIGNISAKRLNLMLFTISEDFTAD